MRDRRTDGASPVGQLDGGAEPDSGRAVRLTRGLVRCIGSAARRLTGPRKTHSRTDAADDSSAEPDEHIVPLVTDVAPIDPLAWASQLSSALKTANSILCSAPRRRSTDSEAALAALRGLVAVLGRGIRGTGADDGAAEAPSRNHEAGCPFDVVVRDDTAGVTYTAWTDGLAVGWRCAREGGRDSYLYLVPSDGHTGGAAVVAVHHGHTGAAGRDAAVHHVAMRPAEDGQKAKAPTPA